MSKMRSQEKDLFKWSEKHSIKNNFRRRRNRHSNKYLKKDKKRK